MTSKPQFAAAPNPGLTTVRCVFLGGCGKYKFDLDREIDDQDVEGELVDCSVCGTLTIDPFSRPDDGRDTD